MQYDCLTLTNHGATTWYTILWHDGICAVFSEANVHAHCVCVVRIEYQPVDSAAFQLASIS
jgi:hypothetical protein